MATVKWSAPILITAIAGTDLNALASGTAAANFRLGPEIDNTVDRLLYGDLLLRFSSAITAGSSGAYIGVYLLAALDGTNYPTTNGGTTAGPTSPANYVGGIGVIGGDAVQSIALRGIVLPPLKFKIMINNVLGAAFPSTNTNTASLYAYTEET